MPVMKLYYIDQAYTIPFEVDHEIFPLEGGRINSAKLKALVIDTVGNFGKRIDVPEIFMEKMEEEDFDRLIVKITYKLESLLLRFYLGVPDSTQILFTSHEDGSLYRLFAVNEIFSAIKPVNNIDADEETVWARHEQLIREFTLIA